MLQYNAAQHPSVETDLALSLNVNEMFGEYRLRVSCAFSMLLVKRVL